MSSKFDFKSKRSTRQPGGGRGVLGRSGSAEGSAVRRIRKHSPDFKMVGYVSLLVVIGLIIIFAIGPQRANQMNSLAGADVYSNMYFVIRQSISVLIAAVAFWLTATFLNFDLLKRWYKQILIIGLSLSALLLLLGNVLGVESVAQCALGACRWFVIPGFGNFQPSEALKIAIIIYLAVFLSIKMKKGEVNDINTTIIPVMLVLGVASFFVIFAQKDLGTGVAIVSIIAAMLVMSGVSWRILGAIGGILLAGAVLMIVSAPHRIERVATFFQGDEASISDDGYHITHAKIAIGSGGLFGVGVGNSVQATGYVPEAINDSIIAILGETFGFVGLMVIIGFFMLLLLRLLKIMDHVLDDGHKLVVAGVFGWISAHVVINIAAMTGLMPLTGITLPFLSYGGSSMLFVAAALGMVFYISRFTTHNVSSVKTGGHHESSRSRGRVRRTRHASSSSRRRG